MAMINKEYSYMPEFAWAENVPPISEDMFKAIIACTNPSGNILELGSGTTTKLFAKQRKIYSVEHNKEYVGSYNLPEYYIYAPMNEQQWYTFDSELPAYDCLLVDGPDNDARILNFIFDINRFDKHVPWFIDDIKYAPYKKDIEYLVKLSGKKWIEHNESPKAWGVLV